MQNNLAQYKCGLCIAYDRLSSCQELHFHILLDVHVAGFLYHISELDHIGLVSGYTLAFSARLVQSPGLEPNQTNLLISFSNIMGDTLIFRARP